MWLAFAMVFLAEWADKGQVAISLMAQSGPLSGTLLGAQLNKFEFRRVMQLLTVLILKQSLFPGICFN